MSRSFQELFRSDIQRYGDSSVKFRLSFERRFHYYLRRSQTCRVPLLRAYFRLRLRILSDRRGLEIYPSTSIGKGLYLGHPYGITINHGAKIGENVNIHKGATIGQENRGPREGAPTIGNRVWIGINAVVVGRIQIGDDVLIAPNSYVNRDVPAHSVVFGNPCVIKPRTNATEKYINRTV